MEIYNKLPEDIQHKMFIYFRHPIAQQLHKYPWVIPQVINQWPSPPTTRYRIVLAKMVTNSSGVRQKRCGCIYYEQHQVCCDNIPEEELDSWDPVVRATPIQQAILKSNVCSELKKKLTHKYQCEVTAMRQEN